MSVENSIAPELVNQPQHYIRNGMEVIDVIEAFDLDRYTSVAVKYILRAGEKSYPDKTVDEAEIIDIEKAIWYLKRKIEFMQKK